VAAEPKDLTPLVPKSINCKDLNEFHPRHILKIYVSEHQLNAASHNLSEFKTAL